MSKHTKYIVPVDVMALAKKLKVSGKYDPRLPYWMEDPITAPLRNNVATVSESEKILREYAANGKKAAVAKFGAASVAAEGIFNQAVAKMFMKALDKAAKR